MVTFTGKQDFILKESNRNSGIKNALNEMKILGDTRWDQKIL